MSKKICCDCGKAVKKDEIALAKKLIDEDTEEFYCLPCMAEYFGCDEEDLKIKIREFKESRYRKSFCTKRIWTCRSARRRRYSGCQNRFTGAVSNQRYNKCPTCRRTSDKRCRGMCRLRKCGKDFF